YFALELELLLGKVFAFFSAAGLGTAIASRSPSVRGRRLSKKSGMKWITEPLRRFLCGLGGHELMRSYSLGRLWLKFVVCSYETPGWIIKEPVRQPIAQRAHALIARWAGN